MRWEVSSVYTQVQAVGGMVGQVAQEQIATRSRVEYLAVRFDTFLAGYLRDKEVQLAATRLTDVRAEIARSFGHFAEVRRHTTGILQATDVAIVRRESMRLATENLMLACPKYWLAPALVSLTAWVSDNRPLAGNALAEALKRDRSKASLFYALLNRRANRMDACARWLLQYLELQNATALEREVVVVLDAIANGVFGGAALDVCTTLFEDWIEELERDSCFADEQRLRWAKALSLLGRGVGAAEYPTLRKWSSTWPELDRSLAATRRNNVVLDFFEQIFAGEIVAPQELVTAVDQLLESLVTHFDHEELPLRAEERRLQLIIECSGEKDKAEARFDAEAESRRSHVSFAALLANAAMDGERSGATLATRRYAVSRSRKWIISGFESLVGGYRSAIPAAVELACGSWRGTSRDGTNESQLVDGLNMHYAARTQREIDAANPTGFWETVVLIFILCLVALAVSPSWVTGLIGACVSAVILKVSYDRGLRFARSQIRESLDKERLDCVAILRACLAELADYRRELAREDARAADVQNLLASLSSNQFIMQRPEQPRAVIRN